MFLNKPMIVEGENTPVTVTEAAPSNLANLEMDGSVVIDMVPVLPSRALRSMVIVEVIVVLALVARLARRDVSGEIVILSDAVLNKANRIPSVPPTVEDSLAVRVNDSTV